MANKWGKPYNCPSLLPWECFQATRQRVHQLKRWIWELEETNMARVCQTGYQREESYTEKKSGKMQRVTLGYSVEYWLAHVCVRKLPKARERTTWMAIGSSTRQSQRSRNSASYLQPNWKTTIHGALSSIVRRVLPQSWDIIGPRLNIPCSHLKTLKARLKRIKMNYIPEHSSIFTGIQKYVAPKG